MSTAPSDPELAATPLDETEGPRSMERPVRGEADDAHKAWIHAALFDGRPLPPERLGRFVLQGMLGRGGMGTVLEAYDTVLDRKVALKVLHPTVGPRHARRLVREARALARLSHPNVVHVYEVGEVDGRTFIAMELVRGRTLRQWQDGAPPPGWQACVEAYLQAGQGLAAAHAAGLVHRDFKPGNCIIDDDGRVRVLDFGLVREFEAADEEPRAARPQDVGDERVAETMTRTGALLGTVAYMAPEQLEGTAIDARADQFGFCVSLYEALYGERPFDGETPSLLARAVSSGAVRPAPAGSRVPSRLRAVLLRGLSADPARRWPSMSELLEALRRVVAPRIQVVSKMVELGATAMFWISVIAGVGSAASIFTAGARGGLSPNVTYVLGLHAIFGSAVLAGIFRRVAKLAALYGQGRLFTAANVRHLRGIGLLATLLSIGVELEPDGGSASLDFVPGAAVVGLVVVFVSWVMDEARRLEERHRRAP